MTMGLLLAGFWKRFAAFILDSAIVFAIYFVVLIFVVFLTTISSRFGKSLALNGNVSVFLAILVAIFYSTLSLSSPWQATLGGRLLGIYLARAKDNNRIGINQSFSRSCLYVGPFYAAFLLNILLDRLFFSSAPLLTPKFAGHLLRMVIDLFMLCYYSKLIYSFCFGKIGVCEQSFVDKITHTEVVVGRPDG